GRRPDPSGGIHRHAGDRLEVRTDHSPASVTRRAASHGRRPRVSPVSLTHVELTPRSPFFSSPGDVRLAGMLAAVFPGLALPAQPLACQGRSNPPDVKRDRPEILPRAEVVREKSPREGNSSVRRVRGYCSRGAAGSVKSS